MTTSSKLKLSAALGKKWVEIRLSANLFFTKQEASSAFFGQLAAKYKISLPEAQQRWQFAKDKAEKDGKPNNVPYILQIVEQMRGEKDRFAEHKIQKEQKQREMKEKSPLYKPAAPSGPAAKANIAAPIFTFSADSGSTSGCPFGKCFPRSSEHWKLDPREQLQRTEFVRRAALRTPTK